MSRLSMESKVLVVMILQKWLKGEGIDFVEKLLGGGLSPKITPANPGCNPNNTYSE